MGSVSSQQRSRRAVHDEPPLAPAVVSRSAPPVHDIADWIRDRLGCKPQLLLVLGSGLGGLAKSLGSARRVSYDEIPHWPRSTAIGHAGNLIAGNWAGVEVLALQGRLHLYEGYPWSQVTLPIEVAARLGARGLVVSNAAGGLNPGFRCGDLMVIDSHLNLLFRGDAGAMVPEAERPESTAERLESTPERANRLSPQAYDRDWIERLETQARRLGIGLHRGVYAAVTGPNYETRAEYRAFRRLGADAVGMSTVPEVIVARRLGLSVLGVSVITNEAKPDAPQVNDGEDVLRQAQAAEQRLERLLEAWLRATRPSERR